MTISPASTANLAARLVAIADAKAELDAEADEIKAQLRDLGPGSHAAGDYKVSITVQRRFDPTLAKQVLSDETFESLCTAFDTKRAKQVLAPAIYDACCGESGEPRVTIR